jgi:hypothetical protein
MANEPVDLEPFGSGDLKVEITVRAGDLHGVQLSTIVDLPSYRDAKARVKLREIITMLFDSLPLTELRTRDREYGKETPDAAIGPEGSITVYPKGWAQARAGQEDLRKKLQGRSSHDDTKTGVREQSEPPGPKQA